MNCAAREWMDEVSMDLVLSAPSSSPRVKCQTLISSRCAAVLFNYFRSRFYIIHIISSYGPLSHGSLTSVIENILKFTFLGFLPYMTGLSQRYDDRPIKADLQITEVFSFK